MPRKGFVYFFPRQPDGQQVATPRDFADAGFAHALDGPGVASIFCQSGPDGLSGVLAAHPSAPNPRYDKAKQVWRKSPAKDGRKLAYVGVAADAKPGPDDLLRDRAYAGNGVRLLDGSEWVVPRCHAVLEDRPPTLPMKLDLADDAETVILRPHKAFEELSRDAYRFWMDWSGQSAEQDRLAPSAQVKLAAAALAVNYRIGLLEAVGLLGLWGTVEFGLILRAMIDADAVAEHVAAAQKKAVTEPAGPSSAA